MLPSSKSCAAGLLVLFSVHACAAMYLSPQGSLIFRGIDKNIEICNGSIQGYCEKPKSERWLCTIHYLEDTWETYNVSTQFFTSYLPTDNLSIGIHEIICTDVVRTVNSVKLVLGESGARLDCASAPAILYLPTRHTKIRYCIKHIPVRASWLLRIDQLRSVGFFEVSCKGLLRQLPFVGAVLSLENSTEIYTGNHSIQCDQGILRTLIYRIGGSTSFIRPVQSIVTPYKQTSQPLVVRAPSILTLADQPLSPAICTVQQPYITKSMPSLRWLRLSGNAEYEVANSSENELMFSTLHVLNTTKAFSISAFQCQWSKDEACYSKLWIVNRVSELSSLQYYPQDRIQTFYSHMECQVPNVPSDQLEIRLKTMLGHRAFFTLSENKVNWTNLDHISRRFLVACDAKLIYMNVVYSRASERVFFYLTATAQLNFIPTENVFWRTGTLRCENNSPDKRAAPYMILAQYPKEFKPRLSYAPINLEEFVPGEYVVKCYLYGASVGKRMLTKTIYVAVPPTALSVMQYVTKGGKIAMQCIDNGYPEAEVEVHWTVSSSAHCCTAVGQELIASDYAVHGAYPVHCSAVVRHPLITVHLNTTATFLVIGTPFRPEEMFTRIRTSTDTSRRLLHLLWAFAYLAFGVLTILLASKDGKLSRVKYRKEKQMERYVEIPTADISVEQLQTFVHLANSYSQIALLVGLLVRQSRQRKRLFVVRGFDWNLRRTGTNESRKGKERYVNCAGATRPPLLFLQHLSLNELQSARSHGLSSAHSVSSLDNLSDNAEPHDSEPRCSVGLEHQAEAHTTSVQKPKSFTKPRKLISIVGSYRNTGKRNVRLRSVRRSRVSGTGQWRRPVLHSLRMYKHRNMK